MMLVILFLMEFARGMYILSYINFLPTVTSIAIAITSFAFPFTLSQMLQQILSSAFYLKFGSKLVLTSGFLLAFISLF